MTQWQPPQYDPRQHQQRLYGQQQPPQPPPWQQPGYGQPPPQPPAPQHARRRLTLRGWLVLITGAAVIVIAASVLSSGGGPRASWKAHVEDTAVINPGDVAVTVQVTNTGNAAGTPTCTVTVSDPAASYTGFDQGTLTKPVQPGQTATYVDNVSVSGNGAQYVTQATASC